MLCAATKAHEILSAMLGGTAGHRRGEIVSPSLENVKMKQDIIVVPEHAKRTRCVTILHPQLKKYLPQYFEMRKARGEKLTPQSPLVVGRIKLNRIDGDVVNNGVKRIGRRVGIHIDAGDTDEKFTTHNLRHYFTTTMKEHGMKDDYIDDLRGDLREGRSSDGYYHIPVKKLKEEYFKCCPIYDIPDDLFKI
ncbi:hypothetical protein MsAg5_12960 [Methanosarcinaceae archaeon Ag5]|uniref:Tyr recombinase domain-containing protein n=1 Tax=Methanolapillus africanus TaxID=3028297 RepID=A0AAE4MK43_9EURY|nr:hypothetical protein [Methanosarcinaceae archaeon Ag5]